MALANGANDNGIAVKPKDAIDLGGSVTETDIWKGGGLSSGMGGVFNFYVSGVFPGWGQDSNELLPALPAYWSRQRDRVLSMTMKYEPFWNGAVKKAIAKGVTQKWDLKARDRYQASRDKVHELFKASNGRKGFKHFLSQHLQDYFLTDNGAFIEIDREDNRKPGSKIIGLYHLDSLRCYRTGDPDYPVIYQDLLGNYHRMTWWQVWDIADTPNARNNYFGIGDCAAAGSYERIRRMVAIRLYEYQKMTGASPKEINFIGGITQQQLDMILTSNSNSQAARGMSVYGGAAFIAMMSKDAISHVKVPVASLPDNYKQDEEIEQAAVEYSNELGISKIDLKPLMGRMSGTATQSDVIDSQNESGGLGLWSDAFEDFINEMVTPSVVTFLWALNNTRQRKAQADVATAFVGAASGMVAGQILTPDKAGNWLVDNDVMDQGYLTAPDLTDMNVLGDDDKPDVVDQETGQSAATAAGTAGAATTSGDDAVAQASSILGV